MKVSELSEEINVLMRAKYPFVIVETYEEIRAISLFAERIGPAVNRTVHIWSFTKGLKEYGSTEAGSSPADPFAVLEEIEATKTNGTGKIFILLDYERFIPDNPGILRKLRDLSESLLNTKKTIVFISPKFQIPDPLSKNVTIFDLPLPAPEEIEALIAHVLSGVTDQVTEYRNALNEPRNEKAQNEIRARLSSLVHLEKTILNQWAENKTAIIDACKGLTFTEIENIGSRAVVKGDLNVSFFLSEKKQIIRKSGSIEYFETDLDMTAIGGMKNLKDYARRAEKAFSKKAREYGVPAPRGILLVGAPGTGKSLFAKAISSLMKKPLLRLDLSAQKSKWVGESEGNLIKSLKVAHAIEPAILWVDEIDKTIARGSNQDMHEVSAGMLGILLTDMEEKPGLFFLATCNSPFNLPPELLSRFQKIFYVDLPTEKEREEIFNIQIRAIGRDPSKINLSQLAKQSPGYSGREIRNIITESISVAFDQGLEDLNTETIADQIRRITPISIQKKEEIERMRAWAGRNAEHANEPEITQSAGPAGIPGGRSLEI